MNIFKVAKSILSNNRGWIPAAIGAAAAIGSSLIGAKGQADANEMNYRIHRENLEYNKPINQMKRFEEAGLNPNLIYTQGNAGNATAQPVMKSEAPQIDLSPIVQMLTAKNMNEQTKNLRAQNTLIGSQSAAAAENARRTKLENDFFEKHGYWPGQESNFFRGLRGGLSILPEMYFNSVDAIYPFFSSLVDKGISASKYFTRENAERFLYHYFGPRPAGWNKVDWSGGKRG